MFEKKKMSAEDGAGAAGAGGPSAGQEGQAAQVELGVYKNPELIESVVVFDPIGGANQKFLDTMQLAAFGMTGEGDPFRFGQNSQPWQSGGVVLAGQTYTAGSANSYSSSYTKIEVCREIDNPGGLSKMDVRTATNPINFRFDGVPIILPRESYIEVTLKALYLGPPFRYRDTDRLSPLDWLGAHGWSRTSSSLIQLVSAVDVSATSFQSPDMITQNFLEAVSTKDTEIELREGQVYFNSYVTSEGTLPEYVKSKVTRIDIAEDDNRYGTSLTESRQLMDTDVADCIFYETPDFPSTGEMWTGQSFDVVFRIPLSQISPVFKVDVLPLFLTNSTNINIQLQVQNPNVGFPFHNPFAGNPDTTTYLDTSAVSSKVLPCLTAANLAGTDENGGTKVLTWLEGTTIGDNDSGRNLSHGAIWPFGYDAPSVIQGIGRIPGATASIVKEVGTDPFSLLTTARTTSLSLAQMSYLNSYTKLVNSAGSLAYMYWSPSFTIKAYIKTYASPYNNPLVNRYLRPYMVGPEGAATFFRSAFLSYNFNAMTYTVPPKSSIPFNFNISQTLINVPMAYLLFSEISIDSSLPTNYTEPMTQYLVRSINEIPIEKDSSGASVPVETVGVPREQLCLGVYASANSTEMSQASSRSPYSGYTDGQAKQVYTYTISQGDPSDITGHFLGYPDSPALGCLGYVLDYSGANPKYKTRTYKYGLLDTFYRSQYLIDEELDINNVQVSIGPSGWNLYQRPLDMKAMNEITLNTLTRYDSELVWKERVTNPRRWYRGDAFACFDLSHDMYRGLFIDADNMLNITGTLTNKSSQSKTVYIQCILPYMDHFVINLQDSTVTKSQL